VKEILLIILILFFNSNSFANFKEIKKKAVVNKPEIIFPIPKNLKNCQTKLYVSPELNKIEPILKVKAPIGYGLDDRYDYALSRFTNFTFPCSGGNIEACEHVKNTILNWAKANAAKRTGPSDHEGRHWNDTLTVNLYVASPMLAAYSFAKQIISIPKEEDRIIKNWFKNAPGSRGIHFHPFPAQTEPRRPISGQILTKLPTVYFNKDQILGISDDLDLIFWISDDFDKSKKMRNVRTIIFHQASRRDLCHVSENKGFCFAKKILFHLKTWE